MIYIILILICLTSNASEAIKIKNNPCVLCDTPVKKGRHAHILEHFTVSRECCFCDFHVPDDIRDHDLWKNTHLHHIKEAHIPQFIGLHLYFFNTTPYKYGLENLKDYFQAIKKLDLEQCTLCAKLVHPLSQGFHIVESHLLQDGQCVSCHTDFFNNKKNVHGHNWLKAYKHAQIKCITTFNTLKNICFAINEINESLPPLPALSEVMPKITKKRKMRSPIFVAQKVLKTNIIKPIEKTAYAPDTRASNLLLCTVCGLIMASHKMFDMAEHMKKKHPPSLLSDEILIKDPFDVEAAWQNFVNSFLS